jgi:hypothetical protein
MALIYSVGWNAQLKIRHFPMIPREILKKIRQIELRTNRLVTEFAAGARASARFTARTTAASQTNPALHSLRPLKRRERRAPVCRNYGEFAIIKKQPTKALLVLIPSNSIGLEIWPTRLRQGDE